jgi:hypothetical protein
MARPITPTPKLNKQESISFLKKVERDLRRPVGLVPTPKLNQARDLIRVYALQREK